MNKKEVTKNREREIEGYQEVILRKFSVCSSTSEGSYVGQALVGEPFSGLTSAVHDPCKLSRCACRMVSRSWFATEIGYERHSRLVKRTNLVRIPLYLNSFII